MSEIEQIQKDVDKILIELDTLINSANLSQAELDELKRNLYERYYDISDTELLFNQLQERFGLDKDNADKFNFAVITKTEDDVEYQEFWMMANAYYDYVDGYFHKIDMHNTSFGIQIQGKGAFPGEAQLGYYDNSGINVWRNPSLENLDWATTEQKRCLVETGIIGEYDSRGNIKTFAVSCGWNNSFMFDSYGGMTIGGTGFEIDGNGIFPYTRVANCLYTNPSDNKEYGYIALLHNAYNSTRYGWDCDSNRTYSWLMGIHAPVDETLGGNNLDLTQADFRVMYNDTPWNGDNTHELDISKWHTILKVDMDSIESMVNGTLTTLGGGSTYVHPTTKQCDYAYTHPTTKQCNYTAPVTYSSTTTTDAPYGYLQVNGSSTLFDNIIYNIVQRVLKGYELIGIDHITLSATNTYVDPTHPVTITAKVYDDSDALMDVDNGLFLIGGNGGGNMTRTSTGTYTFEVTTAYYNYDGERYGYYVNYNNVTSNYIYITSANM